MTNPSIVNYQDFTPREVFCYMRDNLLRQNAQSLSRDNWYPVGCVYRGDNGTKCAVGWLIPDNLYTANLEGRSAKVVAEGLLPTKKAHPKFIEMMTLCQHIHDYRTADQWVELFKMAEEAMFKQIPESIERMSVLADVPLFNGVDDGWGDV